MTWTCDQTEARLSDYLEGLLQGPERADFEAHLHQCAECGPLVEGVRNLLTGMQSVEQLEVPSGLVYRILEQTLGPRERLTFGQRFTNFISGLATPKFAYGAASVVATLFIVLSASDLSWRKPKLADINPTTLANNVSKQYHLKKAGIVKYVSDLRVVYEIQSRLRQDERLQPVPEETTPKPNQNKPGSSDDDTRTQPKQQNRADEFLVRQVELLASECVVK